jgi:hypothetical protein
VRVRMHKFCTVPLPVCLLPHPLSPFPLLLICLFLPLLPPPAPLALCRAASCFAALCAAAASCSLPALSFLQSALCACRPCAAASPPPLSASSPPLLCIAATASSCTACIRCHILCTQVEEFIPRMLRLRQKQPVAPGVPVVRAGGLCCHAFRCHGRYTPGDPSLVVLLLWHDGVAWGTRQWGGVPTGDRSARVDAYSVALWNAYVGRPDVAFRVSAICVSACPTAVRHRLLCRNCACDIIFE